MSHLDHLLADQPGACAALLVALPQVPHRQPEGYLHMHAVADVGVKNRLHAK